MAAKGDQNMWEVYNDCIVINSHIFICVRWFYSHSSMKVYDAYKHFV